MIKRGYYFWLYGLVLSGLTILVVFVESVDVDLKNALIKEGGPIESVSAAGYFVCLIMTFLFKGSRRNSSWHVMFVLLICGVRELDFDQRFTTWNISRIELYLNPRLSPNIPIVEKMIGAAVILLLLYSVCVLVARHLRDVISATRQKEPYAIGVVLGILLLGGSQILDGLKHKLAVIGINGEGDVDQLVRGAEEILELGAPFIFMIAIAACVRRTSSVISSNKTPWDR